jgi:hypothetical protein
VPYKIIDLKKVPGVASFPIAGIVVGPTAEQQLAESATRGLASVFTPGTWVRSTEIPYRMW